MSVTMLGCVGGRSRSCGIGIHGPRATRTLCTYIFIEKRSSSQPYFQAESRRTPTHLWPLAYTFDPYSRAHSIMMD